METTIFLTRAGFDLANTLLSRGSFHHPIEVADIDCAALPELVRKRTARIHCAPPGATGTRVEMLVTEMDLELTIRRKPD